MDIFLTILAIGFLSFLAGYITHWHQARKQRRLLRAYRAREIELQRVVKWRR